MRRTQREQVWETVAQVHIHLLGTFECRQGDEVFDPALSRKTRAILAYLAASDRAHTRQSLYNLFCQEADDPAGTLRWHLSRIRRQLDSDIIITQHDTVQFNHAVAEVDSHRFQRLLDEGAVQDALLLYRGEFLEGLNLPDAPEFEMWLLAERTQLQQRYQRGLLALIESLIEGKEYPGALEWAQELVQSDPLLEMAHARVMWLYAILGQRDAAMKQFDQCRDILERALAVEPSDELIDLHNQILAGDIAPRIVERPVADLIPPSPLGEAASLVGREDELSLLHQTWQSTQQYAAAVVVISAEAGGGKTSLVETFSEQVPDGHFVDGRSYESSRYIPYYPWVTLLEDYVQTLDDGAWDHIAPFWLEHLDRLLPTFAVRRGTLDSIGSLTGIKEQHLFRAVDELLLRLPDRPPLIVFLDDIQWADGASLRLLQYLVSRATHDIVPVMIICAFRPEEAGDNSAFNTFLHDLYRTGDVTTLEPSPLDTDSIDILIQRHGLDVGAEDIWEATRGNPLYVVEILNELVHMTSIGQRLPIPPSLNGLVEHRLGQLSASGRQVMEAIAVIDAPVTASIAQQASGRSEDEVVDAIDAGLRWGFLLTLEETRPPQFDYQHDLLREAVREQLTAIRRQRLHERAAHTLMASSAPASQIAFHWYMAGNDDQEGHFSLLAGKEAARLFVHDDAIRYLERALELVKGSEKGTEVLIKLGDIRFTTGEWDLAEAHYRDALVLASAEKLLLQQADAKSHLGMLMRNQGKYDASIRLSKQALTLYEELNNLKGQMFCIGGIGSVHWRQADYAQALECYDTQYDMAVEINDLEQAMIAQGSSAGVYMQIGEHELALQNFEEALELARQINDQGRIGKIIGNMGLVYHQIGDYQNAMRCFFEQLAYDHELGDKLGMSTAVSNIAALSAREGHNDSAIRCSSYQLQQSLAMNDRRAAAIALNNIALVEGRRGNNQRADLLSALSIKMARRLGIRYHLCAWLHQEAWRLLERDHIEQARIVNEEALATAHDIERGDVAGDAQLLHIELLVRLGTTSPSEALAELAALLDNAASEAEQAATLYTMWRIDNQDIAAAEQAADLYHNLYAKSPDFIYRDRYHELTGETLPMETMAPELPEYISDTVPSLDDLIAQVDALPDRSLDKNGT